MSPRLPAGAVKAQNAAILARQLSCSDRAGDGGLGGNVIVIKLIEGYGADDDREQLRRLAIISHVDALAGSGVALILFGVAMTFVVDECTGDAQADAAAGVNVDAPVASHHAMARETELRMLCLIAKAAFHGIYRFLDRNDSFELFRFEQ